MTPELVAMLESWLATGTDTQKRHAEFRLAIGDTLPTSLPHGMAPVASSLHAVRLGFRQCLYSSHEGCGCAGTHCYRHGRIVGLADCIDCLKGL